MDATTYRLDLIRRLTEVAPRALEAVDKAMSPYFDGPPASVRLAYASGPGHFGRGETIKAIRALRAQRCMSLAEAKRQVEAWESEGKLTRADA